MKPSRTGRPRQVAQLLSVLEAVLFTQELASEAKSNPELHGMSAVDHNVATLIRFLLSPASQLRAGARAVHWKHMDECTFREVKEDSNALTVLTGCDRDSAGQLSTASRPMTTSTFTWTLTQLTTASPHYGLSDGTVFIAVRRHRATKETNVCTCVYHHREVHRVRKPRC